jgi:UDP-N-acetylglucosamine 2-epimerase
MDIENLNVQSGTHGEQTSKILVGVEKKLLSTKPDILLNIGDTNSTLGSALASAKLGIPIAHVEAGCRCFDRTIPEEINRVVTDTLSNHLFTSSLTHAKNLKVERLKGKILFTGDLLLDALSEYIDAIETIPTLDDLEIDDDFVVSTIHRNFNVDNPMLFKTILQSLSKCPYDVILPLHPRSAKNLRTFHLEKYKSNNIRILQPVGYFEMINLIKNAEAVITDSGGVQREAFFLKTPCITLRDFTEWNETVECGANHLVGTNYNKIVEILTDIPSFPLLRNFFPYGKGVASIIITKELLR